MAQRTYRRNPGVITADVDGDLVTMNAETGEYLSFHDTARRIWELLDTPQTLDGLAAALSAEYGEDAATVGADTQEFLDVMVKDGMVVADPA